MPSKRTMPRVIVVGRGVAGLTSAIRLLERGFPVTICAGPPPPITSFAAAAQWYPYAVAPDPLLPRWASTTFSEFVALSAAPEPGVFMRTFLELFATPPQRDPWFADLLGENRFKRTAEDLPPGYVQAFQMVLPFIETPTYMPYLERRFKQAGGEFSEPRQLSSLEDLAGEQLPIVNCAGVWAGQLVRDPAVYPVRGQIVLVDAPDVDRYVASEEGPLGPFYIFPRSDACVLGGTEEPGNWNLEPDLDSALSILARCAAVEPGLRGVEIVDHRVGLRPCRRGGIRLEFERVPGHPGVIHNYGHGGSGFTLSWGCAGEVAQKAVERWL